MLRNLCQMSERLATLWLFRRGNKKNKTAKLWEKKERKQIPGCLKKLESEFRNMAGDQLFVCFFSEVGVKMYSWTPGFLFVSFLAARNHSFLRFPEASLPNFGSLTQDSSSEKSRPKKKHLLSRHIYIFIFLMSIVVEILP